MQIKYTLDAFASLTSLLNFIESKNTQGAALRWLERYFHDWLIAVSVHVDFILIEALLHKSRIRN